MDTKNLRIHNVRLLNSVGGTTSYVTADEPTQHITSASVIERDDVNGGIWIKDPRGVVYWTPQVNVIEMKWGPARPSEKGKAA